MKYQLALFLSFVVLPLTAQDPPTRLKHFNLEGDLAIQGYDPVSYFAGEPREGKKEHSYLFRGVRYYFADSRNKETFNANPDKYEPAYGGWCAYAMGEKGEKVKVDPETFKIIGGKVYLFYNFWGNNTLDDWNENEGQLKSSADRQWKKYVDPKE